MADATTGVVTVRGAGAPEADGAAIRTVLRSEAYGDATPWTPATWTRSDDGAFTATAEVGAGGWFRLELRLLRDGAVIAGAEVEPVGVGEVFLVAGQSYATSCHEQVLAVADPLGRVTAACPETVGWRIAHDPQPQVLERVDPATSAELMEMLEGLDLSFPHGPHSPFRGSIWPALGDALVTALRVPVGFVHTAVGGTRVAHWQRGTMLFDNLRDAAAIAGDHRAVLWQQGESDASADTPTDEYRRLLRALRDDHATAVGLDRPWLVAKSTYHPTNERPREAGDAVRAAVDALWSEPGFAPGPDTDTLGGLGDHRARFERGAHFTGRGQRAAAALWADAVRTHLGLET